MSKQSAIEHLQNSLQVLRAQYRSGNRDLEWQIGKIVELLRKVRQSKGAELQDIIDSYGIGA